jgi:hypothetical protein
MNTWYKVDKHKLTISPVAVHRDTTLEVVLDNGRYAKKNSEHAAYFRQWESARTFLRTTLEREYYDLSTRCARCERQLAAVNGLEAPATDEPKAVAHGA